MKLTGKQKDEIKRMLESKKEAQELENDLLKIMFFEVNDRHDFAFYVQDIQEKTGTEWQESHYDAYEEELDRRYLIIDTLIKTKNVEAFCREIEYIKTSMMNIDFEFSPSLSKEKLLSLKTSVAKEIIIDNNK